MQKAAVDPSLRRLGECLRLSVCAAFSEAPPGERGAKTTRCAFHLHEDPRLLLPQG